ncbi:hypothetical protein [Candidatus Poriferisodalis sp.]|uniref:hypothetical protein n=1 Tax=Candidatus Poriferisodalis sp. TaxID=3101277 RepID=UPI003B52B979
MINASIVDPIEAHLDRHPGRRSRVTVAALLEAMTRNAKQGRPYTRSAVTETLNSFSRDELAELGVQTAGQTPEPFSYSSVARRIKQLEHALAEGWTADGVEYDLDWFNRAMIAASLPAGIGAVSHAEAADATTLPAWADVRDAAADRGYASRMDRFASRGINVVMDYSNDKSAATETPPSGHGLPRGRAAAQIAATAAAVAHNRQAAAQHSDAD